MNLFFLVIKFFWVIMYYIVYYVVGIVFFIMVGVSVVVDVCKYEVGYCYFLNFLFIFIEYI